MPTSASSASFGVTAAPPAESGVTGGQVQSATEKPYTPSVAELLDETGLATDRKTYGAGSIVEHTAVIALDCSGSLGQVTLGGAEGVASVSVSTSNGDWPQVTVVWYTGLPTCKSGASFTGSVTVEGKRKAQALGLTATGKIQNSSWAASASLNLLLDGSGEPAAYAFSGGSISASITAIGGTVSAAGKFILTDGPTASSSNTAYASVSATGTAVMDAAAAA